MADIRDSKNWGFETKQLHIGQEKADPVTDARAVPIYASTSYVFHNSQHAADRFGLRDAGNIYGRLTNPTEDVFEQRIAALEGGVAALAVASGAAAINYTFQALAKTGEHIVASKTIYGGTYNLLTISAPLITGIHHKDHDYRKFARTDPMARASYYTELTEMIAQLYSCPCICAWVAFNEGWGQFDAASAAAYIQKLDHTRIIDHASGWHDQKIGKLQSLHVYFRPYHFKPDKLHRAVALTEFGGYTLAVPGHTWGDKRFGYKGFRDSASLGEAFRKLYETQIIPARRAGLAADVYTQLSDVEDEVNGFVTYDRRVEKLPEALMQAIARELKGE